MSLITRNLLTTLRTEIDAALIAVGKKHGVQLSAGSASFTSADATFKLKVVAITDGQTYNRSEDDFKKFATLYYQVPQAVLGRRILINGKMMTVTGLASNHMKRNCKYQFLMKNDNGRGFKTTSDSVRIAAQRAGL